MNFKFYGVILKVKPLKFFLMQVLVAMAASSHDNTCENTNTTVWQVTTSGLQVSHCFFVLHVFTLSFHICSCIKKNK